MHTEHQELSKSEEYKGYMIVTTALIGTSDYAIFTVDEDVNEIKLQVVLPESHRVVTLIEDRPVSTDALESELVKANELARKYIDQISDPNGTTAFKTVKALGFEEVEEDDSSDGEGFPHIY